MNFMLKYKDYELRLDSDDTWMCYELNFTDKSLTNLCKRIDAALRNARRTDATPVLMVLYSDFLYTTATADILADSPGHVWVSFQNARGRLERRKVPINTLVLDTPENRAALTDLHEKNKALEVARKELNAQRDEMLIKSRDVFFGARGTDAR